MKKTKIATILGTRPEIIKLSPVIPSLDKKFDHILIHTGQHYSSRLSDIFFKDLNLRVPDYNVHVGSGSHGYQVGTMLIKIEEIIKKEKPDAVIVQGDTNTTLAGALVASKLNIKLIHIEAGCRCGNRKLPEEINRIVTDHCSDILVAIDDESYENLIKEGIDKKKIFLTGNTSVEALLRNKKFADKCGTLEKLNLKKEKYAVVTVHRAENTKKENLTGIIKALNEISKLVDIVFPIHPRSKKAIYDTNIKIYRKVKLIEPMGYLDFIKLLSNSRFVMTDSGGVQEEAVELNVPCLVLRNETELNEFVRLGKTILGGNSTEKILEASKKIMKNYEIIKKIKISSKKEVSGEIIKIIEDKLEKSCE